MKINMFYIFFDCLLKRNTNSCHFSTFLIIFMNFFEFFEKIILLKIIFLKKIIFFYFFL